MDNQDKIFEKIKTAAQKAEDKDFPGMDKVWARVDEKLDKKVLAKKSKLWQKIAVAASVLLVISVGYQFLKSDEKFVTPKNEIVTVDTTKLILPESNKEEDAVVTTETVNPIIKKNAEKILNNQLEKQSEVAINNKKISDSIKTNKKAVASTDNISESKKAERTKNPKSNYQFKGRIFDAISVHNNQEETPVITSNNDDKAQIVPQKNAPLMVIDGKAITSRKNAKSGEEMVSEMETDGVESIVVLKEPLYIINGIEYSEEDLFGAKPTSPYAPLDKQEIETIFILQDEKATAIYGKKGEKGVVIITTKNKKPVSTSSKK